MLVRPCLLKLQGAIDRAAAELYATADCLAVVPANREVKAGNRLRIICCQPGCGPGIGDPVGSQSGGLSCGRPGKSRDQGGQPVAHHHARCAGELRSVTDNPAAVFVTFCVLVRPCLLKLQGAIDRAAAELYATADCLAVVPANREVKAGNRLRIIMLDALVS